MDDKVHRDRLNYSRDPVGAVSRSGDGGSVTVRRRGGGGRGVSTLSPLPSFLPFLMFLPSDPACDRLLSLKDREGSRGGQQVLQGEIRGKSLGMQWALLSVCASITINTHIHITTTCLYVCDCSLEQAFNSGMDALVQLQRNWRIPSSELRDRLKNLLMDSILKPYSHFYNRCSTVPFSKKHMAQYLKYPPEEVSRIISTAFFS